MLPICHSPKTRTLRHISTYLSPNSFTTVARWLHFWISVQTLTVIHTQNDICRSLVALCSSSRHQSPEIKSAFVMLCTSSGASCYEKISSGECKSHPKTNTFSNKSDQWARRWLDGVRSAWTLAGQTEFASSGQLAFALGDVSLGDR